MNIPLTPVRFLYRAVDLYPRKEAVVSGDLRFNYTQFGTRCEQLAGGLQHLNVNPCDRVAYLSFNNHQLLEGYFGVPLAKAIVMPLNVRLTPAELITILNHAEPKVLIYEADFASMIAAFRQSCPSILHYIAINERDAQADSTYEELLSHAQLDRPDVFSFDENELAEVFYTSGSTGAPKGVALSHRTLYLHALEALVSIGGADTAVELHTIPLFHANGWGKPQTATLMGAKHVMVRRFEPGNVLRLIEAEGATNMMLVPIMANALLHCPELGKFKTSTLRDIHLGGAASSPELVAKLEKAFSCHIMVGYGLTETCPIATTSRPKADIDHATDSDRLFRLSMAGWPITSTEVRVVDTAGQDVPHDMKSNGEVLVRGDNVMDGYYREREATQAAIVDGWLHSGDMAVWDEEGFIHVVDRKKDIIISGGENVSSIEIETAIAAHPAVYECAVFAIPDDKWGEVPAALILLKPEQTLAPEELLVFLGTRLAKFKLPRVIEFAKEPLPKTGTGKILKRELREPYWAGKDRRVQGN
jgi:fatty-acyl-CoA synthase